MKNVLGYAVLLAGGVIIASVGAVAHRAFPPFGLVAAVVMVAMGAVFARTWLGWNGLSLYAGAWLLMTFLWALEGPGGSMLIIQDVLGIGWLAGGAAAFVLASVLPTRVLVGAHGPR